MKHIILIRREKKNLGHNNSSFIIKKSVLQVLNSEEINMPCIVSVMLTDDEGIREYNKQFRNIDSPTDVLSFPMNNLIPGAFSPSECETDPETGCIILGDILININRCEIQGNEFGSGFEHEIKYLTIHSVLHLLGYDHVDEAEMKKQMRTKEIEIIGEQT